MSKQALNKYPRILAELSSFRWAITDAAMSGILKALDEGLTAEDFSLFHKAERLAIADMGDVVEGTLYTSVRGTTGILDIGGPLIPRATAFSNASGIASTQQLAVEHAALDADPSIKHIAFFGDSPGGAVNGISDLAKQIRASNTPTSTYVFGQASSAMYWIAAATDKIVMADTAIAGSIGTIMTVKKTEDDGEIQIVSSQSPNKKLDVESDAGRDEAQRIVDAMADVFITAVADYRGVTAETVLSKFGKGGVLTAKEAVAVGMADGISSFQEHLNNIEKTNQAIPAVAGNIGASNMTLAELMAQHPQLAAEIKAMEDKAFQAGRSAGVETVEGRVKAAGNFLGNAAYAGYPQVSETAAKVVSGELPAESLTQIVAMADMLIAKEGKAPAEPQDPAIPETPPAPPQAKGDELDDIIAADKARLEGKVS
jgi:ClpP class serine protease